MLQKEISHLPFMFARTGLLFLLKLLDQNPTVLCPSTLEPVAEILGHQILSPKLPASTMIGRQESKLCM
uniref:Uncharacterized protein n=1 Tax=Arabidopsis thaliana TaxID=3702 RepID=Q0WNX2_ARATH|nr:hypothetical protein [Arabidopsis thaliana]